METDILKFMVETNGQEWSGNPVNATTLSVVLSPSSVHGIKYNPSNKKVNVTVKSF
jgi:hypothetical protein